MKKLLTSVLLASAIFSAFSAAAFADEVKVTEEKPVVQPTPVIDEPVYTPLGHGWGL